MLFSCFVYHSNRFLLYSTAPSSPPTLSAFWSPIKNIYLEANSSATAEIHFLPFDVGFRQCSILFINEKIGEFLYCIEATATPPLPSPMPVVASPHSVRISSAAAARAGRGAFGGDERVVYWKCDNDESFTEDLYIPLVNEARENALGELSGFNHINLYLDYFLSVVSLLELELSFIF